MATNHEARADGGPPLSCPDTRPQRVPPRAPTRQFVKPRLKQTLTLIAPSQTPSRRQGIPVRPIRLRSFFVLALILVAAAGAAPAQPGSQLTGLENVYVHPGRPAMEVYVLGDVGAPGKWRVDTEVTLFDLLAVANPGGVGAGREDARVHLFRSDGITRELVLETNMSELITSNLATTSLQPGDVLRVETVVDNPFPLQQTIQTVTSIASLVLLIISLTSN